MKNLLLGVLLILVVGIGGFVYRNAVEHPAQPIACPLDALVCPDGTSVSRTGSSCTFPVCPPPNVSLPNLSLSFALPEGFVATNTPDIASIAAYTLSTATSTASSTDIADLIIRRYVVDASSTPLAAIQQTAISGTSGAPVSTTSFSSTVLGNHRFTVVLIERFEGVVDTAYYLARGTDVLRFDAIDRSVMHWANPNFSISTLPAHAALEKLLTSLQGNDTVYTVSTP
ncbi:MAG: hypothetical protein ACYC6X_02215 [Minisyncoccota bacterium]